MLTSNLLCDLLQTAMILGELHNGVTRADIITVLQTLKKQLSINANFLRASRYTANSQKLADLCRRRTQLFSSFREQVFHQFKEASDDRGGYTNLNTMMVWI